MKEYTIVKVSGIPEWNSIPTLDVSECMWLPDCGIRMTQQVCYDDQHLYVHQRSYETNIRATHTAPLSRVSEDSCMEFFFSPSESDGRYFNFEINPNGCLLIGFGQDRIKSVRIVPKDLESSMQIQATYTADGWQASYQIPLSFLQVFYPGYHLIPGTKIRANCYKCGDKTATPHYLAWNKLSSKHPDFHRPCDFGLMVLN